MEKKNIIYQVRATDLEDVVKDAVLKAYKKGAFLEDIITRKVKAELKEKSENK